MDRDPLHARRAVLASLPAFVLIACGGGDSAAPSGPSGPSNPSSPASLVVVAGDDQIATPGWTLPDAVRVRVDDASGRPLAGVVVSFAAGASGSVSKQRDTTDFSGFAEVQWRLSDTASGTATLSASVSGQLATSARASVLDAATLDRLTFATAPDGHRRIAFTPPDAWNVVRAHRPTTDVVLVPPELEGTRVIVFDRRNRPALLSPAWTASVVDDFEVILLPPVAVPLRVRIRDGDFEERKGMVETQLDSVADIWEDEGMGTVIGDITWIDETGGAPVAYNVIEGLCARAPGQPFIEVEVVAEINDVSGPTAGYGCSAGYAFLARGAESRPRQLAHELGHTFALGHFVGLGLMADPPGRGVFEGEIFEAHFVRFSSLNRNLGAHPAHLWLDCQFQGVCIPLDTDLSDIF